LKQTARTALFIVVALGTVTLMSAPDTGWNRFRGPNGSGVSESAGLPRNFGPATNLLWKVSLAGGHSSPILSPRRIFLTAFEENRLLTYCLDRATGQLVWERAVNRPRAETLDPRNNPASPSPAVDGDGNVYVFFGDYGLLSYDSDGNERWRLPLGPFNNLYGMGASPIIAGELVVLACDQQLDSFLVAVDSRTGTVRWKVSRPEAKSGHSSPILHKPEGGPLQVLVSGSFLLTSYAAATGEKLWWVGGLPFEMKSTPVVGGDVLFVNGFASPFNQPGRQIEVKEWDDVKNGHDANGDGMISVEEFPDERTRGFFSFLDLNADGQLQEGDWNYYRAAMASINGMVAIRLGGSGDMTDRNIVWRYHRSVPQLPSPLLYKGVLYMINDGGIATSFRPSTGEVIARGRIRGAVDKYYASPVAADDKIFFVSETGKVAVVKSDGSLEVLAVNDLGSPVYATPAIADGRLYIRTVDALWAFGEN